MSVPRRNGKGLREGSSVAKNLSAGMRQGAGQQMHPPEEAKSMQARMKQGGRAATHGGVKDVAQRMKQGSIKE